MKRKTDIDTVMIHCTDTKEGREVLSTELNEWHRQRNFEPCLVNGKTVHAGYHYLIHLKGWVEQLRPGSERGQHCPDKNMNNRAIAICYVGGKDASGKYKDTRTPEQKTAMAKLVADIKERYPWVRVLGHRDAAPRACPCFDAKKEYS